MNAHRFIVFGTLFALLLATACGQSTDATPEPTAASSPVPTVTKPTPTREPRDERPLVDMSHLLDFVREGIYRNSDGVGSATWLDYDDDGFLDLYLTNTRDEKNALFRNNGDGSFTNIAEQAGVTSGNGNSASVAGDFDNDGCTDLILGGDGGFLSTRPSGFKVFANNCDGTFADISDTAGINAPQVTWSLALGDINNDGLLDLYASGPIGQSGSFDHLDRLYLNNGDRTFTDVTNEAGIEGELSTCSARFSDYDVDGWIDIFVANCFYPEVRTELLRNNGNGTFTDVAFDAGLVFSPSGHPLDYDQDSRMALLLGDYDLDGDLDIFAPGDTDKPMLENNGNGTYTALVGIKMGLHKGDLFGIHSVAASFADFNNDGYRDAFYVVVQEDGSGNGSLYINNKGKDFSQAAAYPLRRASGAATGDYDNDGFVDLVVVTTRARDEGGAPLLLHNRGGENAWITVRTVGVESNRDGIGALVTVHAGDNSYVQEVSAGSGLSSSSPWLTFGLGSQHAPVDIEVRWPSGLVELFEDQSVREIVTLTEGTGTKSESGG